MKRDSDESLRDIQRPIASYAFVKFSMDEAVERLRNPMTRWAASANERRYSGGVDAPPHVPPLVVPGGRGVLRGVSGDELAHIAKDAAASVRGRGTAHPLRSAIHLGLPVDV